MNEKLQEVIKKPWVIPTAVGISAFVGGGAAGYILGYRKGAKEVYAKTNVILDDLHKEIRNAGGTTEVTVVEKTHEEDGETRVIREAKIHSISLVAEEPDPSIGVHEVKIISDERPPAGDPDVGWNYEVERSTRTSDEPYIIHRAEFENEEMGYTQSTVTYYAGDDIMTDEEEVPIYGWLAMTGPLRWGHGSGDPSVVYIRNEMLEHEYECILDPGRYEVEVLGHTIDEEYKSRDLKHSAVPKFRME